MLPNRRTQAYQLIPPAQRAALDAIASVVIMHLEDERTRTTDEVNPVLIQIDGPGDTDLVEIMADRLAGAADEPAPGRAVPAWTVIRFDAWQYQRLAPPWWWLVNAIDRQLRQQFAARGRSVARRKRLLDYRWRLVHFVRDLLPVVPLVLAAAVLWYVSGRLSAGEFVKWVVGVIGALTTLGAFLLSATNGLRRLFVASPANVKASTPTSDPLADLQQRYSYLIRSADSAVVLVIDNLDRCRADYVVELLEGMDTVLRNPTPGSGPPPLVAVLVPAERAWLSDSYLQVYKDFQDVMQQPGRPFGLGFVEKVFDFALRLPRVALAAPSRERRAAHEDVLGQIRQATSEVGIRRLVADVEEHGGERATAFHPVPELRLEAVRRIGELEVDADDNLCLDTERDLAELVEAVAPGPSVAKQVRTAYCVQRTRQLLGGHPIDVDGQAIHRLGLWTILDLRWPVLAHYLARHPDDLSLLRSQQSPPGVSDDLQQVFGDPEAARLIDVWPGAELSPEAVRRFTAAPGSTRRTDSNVFVWG
jgi:hypothetical protein